MARPPALGAPARRIMARALAQLEKRQLAAEADGKEYVLTETDRELLMDAAKMAALLERAKEPDEEKKPGEQGADEDAAALQRLNGTVPVREVPQADGESGE